MVIAFSERSHASIHRSGRWNNRTTPDPTKPVPGVGGNLTLSILVGEFGVVCCNGTPIWWTCIRAFDYFHSNSLDVLQHYVNCYTWNIVAGELNNKLTGFGMLLIQINLILLLTNSHQCQMTTERCASFCAPYKWFAISGQTMCYCGHWRANAEIVCQPFGNYICCTLCYYKIFIWYYRLYFKRFSWWNLCLDLIWLSWSKCITSRKSKIRTSSTIKKINVSNLNFLYHSEYGKDASYKCNQECPGFYNRSRLIQLCGNRRINFCTIICNNVIIKWINFIIDLQNQMMA